MIHGGSMMNHWPTNKQENMNKKDMDKIQKANAWRSFVNDRNLIVLTKNYAIQIKGGLFFLVTIHTDDSGWWTEDVNAPAFKTWRDAIKYAGEKFNLPNM